MLLLSFTFHNYYISLSKINFIENKEVVQITLKVFTNDLEIVLEKKHNQKFGVATKKEIENIEFYFKKYLKNNFIISINNEQKAFDYIGKIYEIDEIIFYLEIKNINEFKIKNTILMEEFDKQENVIQLNIYGQKKMEILTKNNSKKILFSK